MAAPKSYLLDANVFIQAKNMYYSFVICPGFWDSLLGAFRVGILRSIDQVRAELEVGKDEIADWIRTKVPDGFFEPTDASEVVSTYRDVMRWVQENPQFFPYAKDEFAAGADGWLIAYAATLNMQLVTQEQRNPAQRNRVPLPNVAEAFGVTWLNTFEMLEALDIKYVWEQKSP